MLILMRKKDESVMVGDFVRVVYLGRNHGDVVLGFSAPRYIPVYREEIYLRNKIKQKEEILQGEAK